MIARHQRTRPEEAAKQASPRPKPGRNRNRQFLLRSAPPQTTIASTAKTAPAQSNSCQSLPLAPSPASTELRPRSDRLCWHARTHALKLHLPRGYPACIAGLGLGVRGWVRACTAVLRVRVLREQRKCAQGTAACFCLRRACCVGPTLRLSPRACVRALARPPPEATSHHHLVVSRALARRGSLWRRCWFVSPARLAVGPEAGPPSLPCPVYVSPFAVARAACGCCNSSKGAVCRARDRLMLAPSPSRQQSRSPHYLACARARRGPGQFGAGKYDL